MHKILIWGYGVEGQSNLAFLQKKYANSQFYVLTDTHQAALADTHAYQYIYGPEGLTRLAKGEFNLVVKSPGISLYRAELQAALAAGSQLTSAIRLWFAQNSTAKSIIVTGTKGKSTSASLLAYLMNKAGLRAALAGNIGVPVLDTAAAKDYTIFELSSYQLADLDAPVDCFVCLNLYPEHIPWHGSEQQYYLDKLYPLLNHQVKSCVLRADSKLTQSFVKDIAITPTYFNQAAGFYVNNARLYYKDERLLHNFVLKGEHNLLNLAACLTVLERLKINWRPLLSQLQGFAALPHRMQERFGADGVLYVNDSISTTPDSCYCALKSYRDKKIHLILGGDERGLDYTQLLTQLDTLKLASLSLIGTTGQRISKQLAGLKVSYPWSYQHTLEQAMPHIQAQAQAGDCVLLSPAAPSFDQFKNYQARGDLFYQLAK